MTTAASPSAAAAATAPGISPSDLSIGQLVNIEARTWANINKPGGTAQITHIHYDDDPANPYRTAKAVDVIYSLGGRESNLELTYVKMYVEVARNARSRRQDVKMNVDTLGGQPEQQQQKQNAKSNRTTQGGMTRKEKKKTKNKKETQLLPGDEEIGSNSSATKKKAKAQQLRMALASIDGNHPHSTTTTTTTTTTPTATTTRGEQVDAKQSEKSVSVEQHPVSSTKITKKPEGAKKISSTKAMVSETTVKKVAEGEEKRSVVGGKSSSIKKSKPAAVVDMKDTQQQGAVATSGKTSIKSSSSSSTTKRKGYKQLSLSFGLQVQQPPPPPKVQAVAGVDSSNNSHTPQTNILAVKSSAHDVTKISIEPCRSTEKIDDSSSSFQVVPVPSQHQKATEKQQRSQTIGSSERHFVTSCDVGVASQNNSVANKSIREKGMSKCLPAEKAIANLSKEKDPLQAEDERRNERAMTKKRKAHSLAIDRDHSSVIHKSKKLKVGIIVDELDTVVVEADGKWELIQDGKLADYVPILQKDQRISYWWSDEDGWLRGNISKGLTRVVTTSTIKWTLTVAFDNGDKHTLTFHPQDKRWRVFRPSGTEAIDKSKKKPPVSEKQTAASSSDTVKFPVGETGVVQRKTTSNTKSNANRKSASEEKKAAKSNKKSASASNSTSTSKPKGYKQLSLSFGVQLQSKVQEVASKIHTSSNSFTALHATALESCVPVESTEIGSSVHPKCLSSNDSKQKPLPDNGETVVACCNVTTQVVSRTSSPSSKHNTTSIKNSKSHTTPLPAPPGKSVLQTLYKKECGKADDFVDYMTTSSNSMTSKRDRVGSALSPGSEDGRSLELILDRKREEQFNSLLSEIMYNQRLDMMDVDELIERMNDRHKSWTKPFTLLEVKPYLQKLHKNNRIFMVEEEGKNGVVYVI